MNALTQIEASIDEPAIAAVAAAAFNQIRAIGENRRSFDLDSQTAAARQVLERLESLGAAKAFMARASEVEDDNTLFCHHVDEGHPNHGDERPVVFCWRFDVGGGHWTEGRGTDGETVDGVEMLGVVADPHAEYGAPLIIPADACNAVFGAAQVEAWEKAKLDREAGL